MEKAKKNDRVEWVNQKGEKGYGVVTKGGKNRITVRKDGGQYEVKGPAHVFHLSAHPLPNANEVNIMKDYTVTGYKETYGHDDSQPFMAMVRYKGKAILEASNDGWGGPNNYYPHNLKDNKAGEVFAQKAKEWFLSITGADRVIEAEDMWLEWEVQQRPFGVSAREYLSDFIEWTKESA